VANDGKAWEHDTSTLLGEPIAVQNSPIDTDDEADPWRVLLHLASDERLGFDYGGGACTIVVPAAELAAGRYDHAACVWQF
jgi:hypothetical protein